MKRETFFRAWSAYIGIKDFEFIKLISKGAFGRVWLVKRKLTGDLYAMKIINFAEKVDLNNFKKKKKKKKKFLEFQKKKKKKKKIFLIFSISFL